MIGGASHRRLGGGLDFLVTSNNDNVLLLQRCPSITSLELYHRLYVLAVTFEFRSLAVIVRKLSSCGDRA